MGHHDIDVGVVWDGVLGDGFGVRRALVGRVVAVFVAEIGEGVVAEFWLVRRRVDLGLLASNGVVDCLAMGIPLGWPRFGAGMYAFLLPGTLHRLS